MPFTGAISNQSSIRSGANFTRHVIIHTPDVVCQVQPSANASGLSNAVITVGTPSSGSVSAVKADYTVLITPSSDYANDLQKLSKDAYYVTYARLDGSGSSIFIGETTFQWTTSHYITVLKDVRVFQRRHRYDPNTFIEYRDFNITYRNPKPRIYDLYSEALEISSGSTVSKSFTPSAESMGGGTISTWAWDTDGNTISTGTSSSQNITVAFTAGTHLVSLTVTDSNGVSNKLSVLIAVIPANYNSILATGMVVPTLEHSGDGHVATLQAYSDIKPYVPGSMAMVCTKVNFRDGTTLLTTDMVGWLGNVNQRTLGDETYQRLKSADIAILDVCYRANTLVMESYPYDFASNPSAWGQLASCTPLDMAWHIISEMSTLSNVCAIDYPSDYGDQTVTAYDTPNGTLVDVMKALSFNNNKGSVQFAPNGEIVFDVSLPYASTSVRDAATVVESFSPQDASFNLAYPSVGDFAIQYVNAGGTRYGTTETKMRDFYGRAPAVTENGVLEERIEYMVFPEDTTAAASAALTGQLAYDHWQAANENLNGSLDNLLGGYLLCRQHEGVWYTLDVSAGDLLNSDITYDSNMRFICTGVIQDYDAEIGSLNISLQLREETGGTANYSVISQELLPAVLTADLPNFPNVPAYPFLEGTNSDDVYGNDYSDSTAGSPDPSGNPSGVGDTINPPAGTIETISIPLTGQTVTTNTVFDSNEDYLITFSGVGQVSEAGSTVNLLNGNGQGDSSAGTTPAYAGWSFIGGNVTGSYNGSEDRYEAEVEGSSGGISYSAGAIEVVVSDPEDITSIIVRFESNTNVFSGATNIALYEDGLSTELASTSQGGDGSLSYSGSLSSSPLQIIYRGRNDETTSYVYITSITIVYGDSDAQGDALFKIEAGTPTAWGGAGGVQFNGANVELANVSPSAYNPSHIYSLVTNGTDDTFSFNFVDTDGDYTDNAGSILATIQVIS